MVELPNGLRTIQMFQKGSLSNCGAQQSPFGRRPAGDIVFGSAALGQDAGIGMISAERVKNFHKRNSRGRRLAGQTCWEALPAKYDRSRQTKWALFERRATAADTGASLR